MATPYVKALLGASKRPAVRDVPLEGEVIGGELGGASVRPSLFGPGGVTIDGQVVPESSIGWPTLLGLPGPSGRGAGPQIFRDGAQGAGGGPPWKTVAAGTAAAGGGAGLMMMGGDDEAGAAPAGEDQDPAIENLSPRQQALVDASDLSKKGAGTNSETVIKNLKDRLPAEDSSWLDKLAGEFDLTTVGMALLASNDGSRPFSANLGDALIAGRAVHKRDKEKAEAKQLMMEDRKIAADQRQFNKKVDTSKMNSDELQAEASMLRAKSSMIGAQASLHSALTKQVGQGFATKTPTKQDMNLLAAEANELVPDLDLNIGKGNKQANDSDVTYVNYLHRNLQLAEHLATSRGQPFTDLDRAEALQKLLNGSTPTGDGIPFLRHIPGINYGEGPQPSPRAVPTQMQQGGGVSAEIQAMVDAAYEAGNN